jgi:multisubunit Na+/H+ antiporter MnhE subunit|tara:strand:- start:39 stop:209 length:171 start_codon:yes stop_codon:yes gene_type:complete
MNKSTIAIILYVFGLIFGAVVLDLWSHETGPKAFIGIIWTALLLIALFFCDKYEQK